jgi:hypothetical protein
MRILGANVASMAIFLARHHPVIGTMVRQFVGKTIRGAAFKGYREDCDEAASGVLVRFGVACSCDERYCRHDAGRSQGE